MHSALFFGVRTVAQFLVLAAIVAGGCGQKPTPVSDLGAERQRMVQQQLMARGINDERVLACDGEGAPGGFRSSGLAR